MKNRLREFRARHGLTQSDLAQKINVSRQTIHAIEKGKYNPSLGLAFKLANLFGTKVEELFVYIEVKEVPEKEFEPRRHGYL